MSSTAVDGAGRTGQAPAAPRRPLLGWDLGVTGMIVVMTVIGVLELLSDEEPHTALFTALVPGVLVAVVVWYLVLGRSALRRAVLELPFRRADALYLCGIVVLIGCATAVVPSYATLQAIGYPMIWTLVERYRHAVIWSAVLALAVGLGFLQSLLTFGVMGGLGGAAAIVLISFAFAVVMGTWITRIFAKGEQYRHLLEELRASQGQVTALSEAAGASAERERLSRELHDTLTQTLAGLVMLSEQAERALDAGDDVRARDRVSRVGAAAREAVVEARALVATTQPLGDGGLEAAIGRVADRLRADAGLEVVCDILPTGIDRERQVVLLRAVQEGLANARKHARAGTVRIALGPDPASDGGAGAPDGGVRMEDRRGGVLLRIDDDGVGPGEAGSGGFGLSGLGDRVRAVGGSVVFGPGPETGSRLEVRLEPCAAMSPPAGSAPGAGPPEADGAQGRDETEEANA